MTEINLRPSGSYDQREDLYAIQKREQRLRDDPNPTFDTRPIGSFAHGLTPAQHERLAMLGEEAGEIAQMVGKIMRFGFNSRHPNGGPTNLDLLIGELHDILAVLALMSDARDMDDPFIDKVEAPSAKIERKVRYSNHQRSF